MIDGSPVLPSIRPRPSVSGRVKASACVSPDRKERRAETSDISDSGRRIMRVDADADDDYDDTDDDDDDPWRKVSST